MPVTELAIIPLTDPTLPDSQKKRWLAAKDVMETATGYQFHYFQQIEDPSLLYVIGKWESVAAHHTFIAGPENQATLKLLKDDYITDRISLWHLSPDIFSSPSAEGLLSAPVIGLIRYYVHPSKKEEFEEKFKEVIGILEGYSGPWPVVGAWRVEKVKGKGEGEGKEVEREEWDLFAGFESLERYGGFRGTEEYREMVGCVEEVEVRGLRGVDGL